MTTKKALIGTKEAGEALGVSTHTILRWVREGRLTPHLITPTGYHKFDTETIQAMRSAMEREAREKGVPLGRI